MVNSLWGHGRPCECATDDGIGSMAPVSVLATANMAPKIPDAAPPMIDTEDVIIFAALDSVRASVDSVAPGISVVAEESGAGASVGEGTRAAVGAEESGAGNSVGTNASVGSSVVVVVVGTHVGGSMGSTGAAVGSELSTEIQSREQPSYQSTRSRLQKCSQRLVLSMYRTLHRYPVAVYPVTVKLKTKIENFD